ncbi:MAG: nucleotide exchange factor GrpE, partial [Rhodospirillales bacterium]
AIDGDAAVRLAELEAEAADYKDKWVRAMAEQENIRRRAQRDREDASKYAIASFARDLLNVADNMERALASIDAEKRATDETIDNLLTGVEMTQRELASVLTKAGVKPVEAEGQRFDASFHEAMAMVPNPQVPDGTVVQVVQSGYILADRLLRPAKVLVATGGPKEAPKPASDADRKAAPSGKTGYDNAGDGGSQGANLDEEL